RSSCPFDPLSLEHRSGPPPGMCLPKQQIRRPVVRLPGDRDEARPGNVRPTVDERLLGRPSACNLDLTCPGSPSVTGRTVIRPTFGPPCALDSRQEIG